MGISKTFKQLGNTITFFTTFRGRNVYYVWYKDGKKLQNECKAHLQITDINQNDYGLYERIATASDGNKYRSQFSLEPPTFSGFDFNRAESVEVELPPNFSIDMRNDSSYSLTASVEFGHPTRIAAYEPPQQKYTEYSSRHDLHPLEISYPKHYHSPQIQPYSPPHVDPASYHGCHHNYPTLQSNVGPSNYYSFERPYPPQPTPPQYSYHSQTGYHKTPLVQATQITKEFKETTLTFFIPYEGRYASYVWYKNGKELPNEYKGHLQITDIKKSDYGLYERVATASDGSKYRSQFSLEPPTFSGVHFNRAESVEVELPPNFQKC